MSLPHSHNAWRQEELRPEAAQPEALVSHPHCGQHEARLQPKMRNRIPSLKEPEKGRPKKHIRLRKPKVAKL